MSYLDFLLQIHPANDGRLGLSVWSPAGEGYGELSLATLPREWSRESNRYVLRDLGYGPQFRLSGEHPREMGTRLFHALLPSAVRSLFERSYDMARARNEGLRFKIFLNPREPGPRLFQSYPWELLFRDDPPEFLSLSRWTPVVRCLPVGRPPRSGDLPERVRVLAAFAAPRDTPALGLQRELSGLKSTEATGRFEIVSCRARLSELRALLQEAGPFHVLHFLGHATVLPGSGEGALLFETADGGKETVTAATLCEKLRDFDSLQLLVLNACKTGRSSASPSGNAFSSVASALIQAGFPAVLAMQEVISDEAAIALSSALYHQLAKGDLLEAALAEARHAVFNLDTQSVEWSVPSLFLRSSSLPRPTLPGKESGSDFEAAKGLFLSGQYSLARQQFLEILKQHPDHVQARLFDALTRIAGGGLAVKSIADIDDLLQSLLRAADPEVHRLARLALGILRIDSVEIRGIRVRGIPSDHLFAELGQSERTPAEKAIAQALAPSRDAMILFNLHK